MTAAARRWAFLLVPASLLTAAEAVGPGLALRAGIDVADQSVNLNLARADSFTVIGTGQWSRALLLRPAVQAEWGPWFGGVRGLVRWQTVSSFDAAGQEVASTVRRLSDLHVAPYAGARLGPFTVLGGVRLGDGSDATNALTNAAWDGVVADGVPFLEAAAEGRIGASPVLAGLRVQWNPGAANAAGLRVAAWAPAADLGFLLNYYVTVGLQVKVAFDAAVTAPLRLQWNGGDAPAWVTLYWNYRMTPDWALAAQLSRIVAAAGGHPGLEASVGVRAAFHVDPPARIMP